MPTKGKIHIIAAITIATLLISAAIFRTYQLATRSCVFNEQGKCPDYCKMVDYEEWDPITGTRTYMAKCVEK